MNVVIKNTRPARVILTRPLVTLLPGENNVDAEAWESNKKVKSVQLWLDKGYLVERSKQLKARPMLEDTTVVDLEELEGNVARCNKPEVLKRWAKNDQRSVAHKMIERRLIELEKEAKDSAVDVEFTEPSIQVPEKIEKKPKKGKSRKKSK